MSFTKFSGSGFNGRNDPGIAGASANLTAELAANGSFAGIWMPGNDIPRHHQHAWRTEAALKRVLFMKVPPDDVHRLGIARAFDGLDIAALAHHREDDAGSHGHAVHRDRAGAARAMFAANVSAGQV